MATRCILPNIQILCFLLICASRQCSVHGETHYYDFVVKETNFTRLCSTRSILTVNDSFPGPEIRVRKGDVVFVNVHNQGPYGVTLHWHGVKQPRNPWSDGPEYVTQCPIQPGTNFTYEVILSDEEGTLWWHAHSDWTRSTVHGAIVILPANGTTYPFPEPYQEQVIILGNWYKDDLRQAVWEAMQTGADTPRSDAYTINGQPGDLCECSNGTTYRLAVAYGKTYLLRLVNAANNADLFFAVANHNMTVVGMDASYTKPIITDYLVLSTGQTADVLIAANQSLGYYYMATRKYSSTYMGLDTFDHANATGILEYTGNYTRPSSPVFPASLPPYKDSLAAWNFRNMLRSLANDAHPVDVPKNVTSRLFYVVSTGQIYCENSTCLGINGNRLAASINNISFVNPTTDILMAYFRNISQVYEEDFPDEPTYIYNFTSDDSSQNLTFPGHGTKVKVLNYNESVEIVFQGTNLLNAAESHPMHLHGHSLYAIGSGIGNFDEFNRTEEFNFDDPPRLNTVSVPKAGWVVVRFRAENPGVWFMHCHYDRHLIWGMDMVFIVRNGATSTTRMKHPPNYMPSCDINTPENTWLDNNVGQIARSSRRVA